MVSCECRCIVLGRWGVVVHLSDCFAIRSEDVFCCYCLFLLASFAGVGGVILLLVLLMLFAICCYCYLLLFVVIAIYCYLLLFVAICCYLLLERWRGSRSISLSFASLSLSFSVQNKKEQPFLVALPHFHIT